MNRATQKWGAVLLAVSLLTGLGCASGTDSSGGTGSGQNAETPAQTGSAPVAGKPAPDFTLKTMSGEEVTLSKLRGKKVVLNFWASWCKPCRTEMPDLKEVARTYEDQILLYGINLTAEDQRELAESMILELGLTFPNLFDEGGQVEKDYRILSIPSTITIDEQGVIVQRIDGQLSRQAIEGMFQHLLKTDKK